MYNVSITNDKNRSENTIKLSLFGEQDSDQLSLDAQVAGVPVGVSIQFEYSHSEEETNPEIQYVRIFLDFPRENFLGKLASLPEQVLQSLTASNTYTEQETSCFIGVIDEVCNQLSKPIPPDHGEWSEIKMADNLIAPLVEAC